MARADLEDSMTLARPVTPAALSPDAWPEQAQSVFAGAVEGLAPSSVGQARSAVGRYVAWCVARRLDPVILNPSRAAAYLREVAPDDITHWNDIAWLRRFSDRARAVGLRESDAFPREVTTSVARRETDPLAPLVAQVVARYRPPARHTVSSDLTTAIDLVREKTNSHPLNVAPDTFDRLYPQGGRARERVWRPYGALLALAAKTTPLGPNGAALLDRIQTETTGGNRRLLPRWRAYAKSQNTPANLVPPLERERFLSSLLAEGADEQAIEAMRSTIRRLEVAAERKGKRPTYSARIERLASRISALGMDMTTAAAVVAAIHAPYKPGVHRSLDAVLIRYIDWAAETGRSPLRIDEPGLMTFVRERGDHLGATPVRRFLAAWDAVAVPAGAKPSGSDVRPVAVRSFTLPPGKGGNTRRPRTAGPLPRDQPK